MKLTKLIDSRFVHIAAAGWAVAAFVLGVSREARADYCGADGERACSIPEKLPSCNVNLVEGAGRCVRPQCGQEGQRACTVLERTKLDLVLKVPVPFPCDQDLKHAIGNPVCFHPSCGREGANACNVFERVPSCDINLVEQGGKCMKPQLCGRLGQAACTVTVRIPSCDADLVEKVGVCERAGSAPAPAAAAPPAPAPKPKTGSPPPPPPPPPTSKLPPPPPPPPTSKVPPPPHGAPPPPPPR